MPRRRFFLPHFFPSDSTAADTHKNAAPANPTRKLNPSTERGKKIRGPSHPTFPWIWYCPYFYCRFEQLKICFFLATCVYQGSVVENEGDKFFKAPNSKIHFLCPFSFALETPILKWLPSSHSSRRLSKRYDDLPCVGDLTNFNTKMLLSSIA